MNRRKFITNASLAGAALSSLGMGVIPGNDFFFQEKSLFFKLSLAQWSLHKAIFSNKMSPMDFAQKAKELGFEGLEYVSQLYKKDIKNSDIITVVDVLLAKSKEFGMKNVLIMVDGEGPLASPDPAERKKAVENHYKWVDAAKTLGCESIRVNAHGKGTPEEVAAAAVAGLGELCDYAQQKGINILGENHGGNTSNAKWLADVMKRVGRSNCGTLPDFGNFCLTEGYGSISSDECTKKYDIYQGVEELMPYAKAVSAKSIDFDEAGNEIFIDYKKMMAIVKKAGYNGFVGVEYEGDRLDEIAGIDATKALLIKVGKELS
jgi:sugar phosphate isomerase/epimerase